MTRNDSPFDYEWIFSWMWKIGVTVAFACAIAATMLPHRINLISALPLIAGILVGAGLELICLHGDVVEVDEAEPEKTVAEYQTDPQPSSSFFSSFWLSLKRQKPPTAEQLDLFEQIAEDPTDRRKVHVLLTNQGQIYMVHCGRFQDLLLSRMVEDIDKATEHALGLALQKYAHYIDPKTQPLFRKTFREVIKADFRGSVAQLLSNVGESVMKELAAKAEKADQPEGQPFRLEPVETRSKRKSAS